MNVLAAEVLPLERTATYKRREVRFTPPSRPGGRAAMEITLYKGLRPGSKPERDDYEIEEEDAVGVMGRSFLVLNVFDDRQPDVYHCVVGPNASCTCKAGLCRVYSGCKHRDAIAAAIAAGLI